MIHLHEGGGSGEDGEDLGLPRLDGHDGPAARLAPDAARALVTATLRAHQAQRRAARLWPWRLAAGLTLFIGASAAVSAAYLARQPAAKPHPAPGAAEPAATVRITDLTVTSAPAPITMPLPAPAEQTPPRASSRTARAAAVATAPATASVTADLLARANHLRGQAHWRQAARAYQQAVRSAPRSPEAYTAMVAAGALHREHLHDARGAAQLFTRALAIHPAGPLSEEARWGLVQAYRQLGRRNAEQEALRAFLQHHPHSVLAPQARQRLQLR